MVFVRRMLTEILLDVTTSEMYSLANEIINKLGGTCMH